MSATPLSRSLAVSLAILFAAYHFAGSSAFAEARLPDQKNAAPSDDRYYVVFLAHQSADNEIRWSHTFAAFLKTTGSGADQQIADVQTISWFPASDVVSIGRGAEPGVNKTLKASVAWAEEHDLEIAVTGPYEIRPELYHRAVDQVARLNRGEFKYKAFDRFSRATAKNCIHALADMVDDGGLLNSGTNRGQDATLMVVRHFESYFVSPEPTESGRPLLEKLNLARFVEPAANSVARSGAIPAVQ